MLRGLVILSLLLLTSCSTMKEMLWEPEFVCDLSREVVWCKSENGKQLCECRVV
jgi:hypothetical protein